MMNDVIALMRKKEIPPNVCGNLYQKDKHRDYRGYIRVKTYIRSVQKKVEVFEKEYVLYSPGDFSTSAINE